MDVTNLIAVATAKKHSIVTMSKACFTDSAEYLLLVAEGWEAVQYDGAVMPSESGDLTVRQVAHMEKKVRYGSVVAQWLTDHGLDAPEALW